MSGALSTHILDLSRGLPAAGVAISVERRTLAGWVSQSRAITDTDGRCRGLLGSTALELGVYRLIFDSGTYFSGQSVESLYPEVVVTFEVRDPEKHHHIPLLLAPNGYTTYRGT